MSCIPLSCPAFLHDIPLLFFNGCVSCLLQPLKVDVKLSRLKSVALSPNFHIESIPAICQSDFFFFLIIDLLLGCVRVASPLKSLNFTFCPHVFWILIKNVLFWSVDVHFD